MAGWPTGWERLKRNLWSGGIPDDYLPSEHFCERAGDIIEAILAFLDMSDPSACEMREKLGFPSSRKTPRPCGVYLGIRLDGGWKLNEAQSRPGKNAKKLRNAERHGPSDRVWDKYTYRE